MQRYTLAEIRAELRQLDEQNITYDQSAKIYFLRNYTLEMIEPFLKLQLHKEKINASISFGDYDVIEQEILSADSRLHSFDPDLIVLSLNLENFYPEPFKISSEIMKHELENLFSLFEIRTSAIVALNTFILPFYSEYGIAQPQHDARTDYIIEELNHYIRKYVSGHSSKFVLLDWDRYIRLLGEEQSIDYRYWYTSQAPFKPAFLSLYAEDIVKIIRALKGKSKKCLILDCDNTLWGGIIGEDGLSGIKLHNYQYPGKAFYDFQKNLMYLKKRGILITICSKNNEDDVWEVLDNHPFCLLKKSHLSAWRINWENKVENIKSIINELNIGMDSVVFVDDNEIECDMVNNFLPDITVLMVPEQLYLYPPLLLKEGLFDTLTISSEDILKAEMYQAENKRKIELQKYENIEEYLNSLDLKAFIHLVKENELARIAQLTQKTNQFNLTTHRYSEAEIMEMFHNTDIDIYSLTVNDRFGDYGLTGVFIGRLEGNIYNIDTLLLSCRILGRKLEYIFVNKCLENVKKLRSFSEFTAEYIATIKNHQVSDFWEQIGFSIIFHDEKRKKYKTSDIKKQLINFIDVCE